MLILSRKDTERIVLLTSDGPVWITHCGNRGERTRIGLDAPPHVEIQREEIYRAKQRQGADGGVQQANKESGPAAPPEEAA